MPSHAPQATRDGKVRSSSLQQGADSLYYTNEDIELLHQVVTLGQEILPTLPRRDKLPTTALFRAADIVFPRYGLNPDGEDKLSRIIFMVGGMRSTDNLLDRFRVVLKRMGIELEYVEEHEHALDDDDDHDHVLDPPVTHRRRSSSRHHHSKKQILRELHRAPPAFASPPSPPSSHPPVPPDTRPSTASSVAQAPPRPPSRPRHNSESAQRPRLDVQAPPLASDGAALDEHEHEREHERPAQQQPPPTSSVSPWLSNVPLYVGRGDGPEQALYDDEDDEDDEDEDEADEAEDERSEPAADPADANEDASLSLADADEPAMDEYTRSLQMLIAPKSRPLSGAPGAPGVNGANGDTHARDDRPLPIRTRQPPTNADSTSPPHISMQATASWTTPQSAHSTLTTDDDDADAPGPSETSLHDELLGEPQPKVDLEIMAKVADTYFLRFAFLGGMAMDVWRDLCTTHREQADYAAEMDREMSASEALLMWSGVARAHANDLAERVHAVQKRHVFSALFADQPVQESSDDDDSSDDDFRQKQAHRERLMRRAARVYTITTLFNTVSHWHAMAQEEASRTRVARRHMVRRRVFCAWRDLTAAEHATMNVLGLGWAVQRWLAVLHGVQKPNKRIAVDVYRRDLVTVRFWTWFRAHQDRVATTWGTERLVRQALASWHGLCTAARHADEVADAMAADDVLRAAVHQWSDQAQGQATVLLRIEEQEQETYRQAAVQDWARAARCARQLRALQEARDRRHKEAVLGVWRTRADAEQQRAGALEHAETREYATHWQRETRLVQFRAGVAFDLKTDALHSWLLCEKLVFLQRYWDEQLARKTCKRLRSMCRRGGSRHRVGETEREATLAQTADELYKAHATSALVAAFHAHQDDTVAGDAMAAYLDRAVVVGQVVVPAWCDALDASRVRGTLADRGAFYVGVVNALDGWAVHARTVRESRLRTTYRRFRRHAKRQAAAGCIDAWRSVLVDVGDVQCASDGTGRGGAYDVADELCFEQETRTIFASLNCWILATNDALFQHTVALEADAELHANRWRLALAQHEDLAAAAAEHDTVVTMAGRWDDWELQAVQARAREHTASVLHAKNGRRLGRRVLAVWQQQVAGQRQFGQFDWRLDATVTSPLATRSVADLDRVDRVDRVDRGSTRPASFLLHPITESPAPRLGYSVPVPASAPIQHVAHVAHVAHAAHGRSPTDSVPLRRLHRSTATPFRRQQDGPTHPAPSSSMATSTTLTPGRDSHRHRLLQRRLQSAARLADSVQLGPMSEFDELDEVDGDDGDDGDELNDHYADVSSEGDDDRAPAFDSKTPTRMLPAVVGSTRKPNFDYPPATRPLGPARTRPDFLRKSAAVAAASAAAGRANTAAALGFDPVTTTPMGPVPTSFERRLRAAYSDGRLRFADAGDGEDERVERVGRVEESRVATPLRPLRMSAMQTGDRTDRGGARVTFADTYRLG